MIPLHQVPVQFEAFASLLWLTVSQTATPCDFGESLEVLQYCTLWISPGFAGALAALSSDQAWGWICSHWGCGRTVTGKEGYSHTDLWTYWIFSMCSFPLTQTANYAAHGMLLLQVKEVPRKIWPKWIHLDTMPVTILWASQCVGGAKAPTPAAAPWNLESFNSVGVGSSQTQPLEVGSLGRFWKTCDSSEVQVDLNQIILNIVLYR